MVTVARKCTPCIQHLKVVTKLRYRQNKHWNLIEVRKRNMFENKVLRRIFEPQRDEVTGDWSKIHNEELNDLYCSPNIFRVIK